MSLSQVTERQAGSPRSSRQPQGKQSAPATSTTSPIPPSPTISPSNPQTFHPPIAHKNRETGGWRGEVQVEGRGTLFCRDGPRETLHAGDYARPTITVGTVSSSDRDEAGSVC